jgi:hypothetical protein
MANEFLAQDQGDGWWHCATTLRCVVIDGPAPYFPLRPDARWPETYWLVRTEPQIEWNGDMRFAVRWGADHPLCRAMPPTSYALVMASSPWSGPIDPDRAGGVAVYPVLGAPSGVPDAEPVEGLAVKAALVAPLR